MKKINYIVILIFYLIVINVIINCGDCNWTFTFCLGIYAKEKQFIIPYKGKEAISFTLFLGNKRVPIEQKVNILQQYCYITENDVKKIDEPLKSNFRLPLKVGNDIHNGFELPIVIYFRMKQRIILIFPLCFIPLKKRTLMKLLTITSIVLALGMNIIIKATRSYIN